MTLITEEEILNAGTVAEGNAVDAGSDTDEVTVIGPADRLIRSEPLPLHAGTS